MPIVGMALAQHKHAPDSFLLVAGWLMNPVVSEIPMGMASEFFNLE